MRKKLKAEFKTISFPKRKDVVKNTSIVMGTSLIVAWLLALLNTGVSELIRFAF